MGEKMTNLSKKKKKEETQNTFDLCLTRHLGMDSNAMPFYML